MSDKGSVCKMTKVHGVLIFIHETTKIVLHNNFAVRGVLIFIHETIKNASDGLDKPFHHTANGSRFRVNKKKLTFEEQFKVLRIKIQSFLDLDQLGWPG